MDIYSDRFPVQLEDDSADKSADDIKGFYALVAKLRYGADE